MKKFLPAFTVFFAIGFAFSTYKWLALYNDAGFALDQLRILEAMHAAGLTDKEANRTHSILEIERYYPAGTRLPKTSLIGQAVELGRSIAISSLSRMDEK